MLLARQLHKYAVMATARSALNVDVHIYAVNIFYVYVLS